MKIKSFYFFLNRKMPLLRKIDKFFPYDFVFNCHKYLKNYFYALLLCIPS